MGVAKKGGDVCGGFGELRNEKNTSKAQEIQKKKSGGSENEILQWGRQHEK